MTRIMQNASRLKVLLVGAGRFGKNHLRVLRELDRDGVIELSGVVVKTVAAKHTLERMVAVPIHTRLTPALLKSVQAVDIVTPADTHDKLISMCLPYAHVFVEKPFSRSLSFGRRHAAQARQSRHTLMVGHIYRFHPLSQALKGMFRAHRPVRVSGSFISPVATYRGEAAVFEEMHFFDLLDFWFKRIPEAVWSRAHGTMTSVSLRYQGFDAFFEIGWDGSRKERTLSFEFDVSAPWRSVAANFAAGTLVVTDRNGRIRTRVVRGREPLRAELETFFQVVGGAPPPRSFPSVAVALRVLTVMERALPRPPSPPVVAIVGGGIFGVTAGSILKQQFRVILFERHPDILAEASYVNQYRHHEGYHYPRSPETIRQIKEACGSFERFYGRTIMRVPSFYAVAKNGSKTNATEFRERCRRSGLPYREAYPPPQLLNRRTVSSCIKTMEAIYDYAALKREAYKQSRGVILRLGSAVTDIRLLPDGRKEIYYRQGGKSRRVSVDYLINATYANHNTIAGFLGFPGRDLEFRFKELAIVEIRRSKPCAVTIVDGPFATLVPTGTRYRYTLGDVPLSVHRVLRRFRDGTFARWRRSVSTRAPAMLRRCAQWFPVLKEARYLYSLFVTLPVSVESRERDDRITSVTDHGFGCFSVLEGKIITSVACAEELLRRIMTLEKRAERGRV